MVDRLRLLWNRPLHEGDRPRLFAIAVALIAAAAGLFSLLDDAGPARAIKRHAHQTPATVSGTTEAIVPASTPVVPSEESDPPPGLRPTSADVARSKRAARRFLAGYLAFTYGTGQAARIRSATSELRAELARHRPRIPASERHRRPRLVLLQSNGVSRERADLVALVGDGTRRYSVQLKLANTPTGWLVTGLGG